jgi:hypothetical protein
VPRSRAIAIPDPHASIGALKRPTSCRLQLRVPTYFSWTFAIGDQDTFDPANHYCRVYLEAPCWVCCPATSRVWNDPVPRKLVSNFRGGVQRGSLAVYATKYVQRRSREILQSALVPSRYSILILISTCTGCMVSLGGDPDGSKRRYIEWWK